MDRRRSRGSAKPLVRFERTKARLQGECQIRFRRQRHDRRQSTVENAESPGCLSIWCATYDGADLVALCLGTADSPPMLRGRGVMKLPMWIAQARGIEPRSRDQQSRAGPSGYAYSGVARIP